MGADIVRLFHEPFGLVVITELAKGSSSHWRLRVTFADGSVILRHFVNFRELISFMREYVDKKIGATG